jgi:DNA-binding transcriptional regulator GbsR (MarR family)
MTDREKYIEDVGIYYEHYGYPRIAGKICGYLMSSNTENNSFDEILEFLMVSKGSISGNLNYLLRQNMIEKHSIKGDRKSYYRIRIKEPQQLIVEDLTRFTDKIKMFQKGNSFRKDKSSESSIGIAKMARFCEFVADEVKEIQRKWEQINN